MQLSMIAFALVLNQTSTLEPAGQEVTRLLYGFEENRGQVADVGDAFLFRGAGHRAVLASDGLQLQLFEHGDGASQPLALAIEGAVHAAPLRGEERLPGAVRYLVGPDPSAWIEDVPRFARLRQDGVLAGVDIVYRISEGEVEYDLHLEPGRDAAELVMRWTGATGLAMDGEGRLVVDCAAGRFTQPPPVAFQECPSTGERRIIEARYRLLDDHRVGFELGSRDPSLATVIDPVLVFSTFFGGSGFERIHAMTVDVKGDVYLAGTTTSTELPSTTGSDHAGGYDAFVAKIDGSGSELLYCTYLGGSGSGTGFSSVEGAYGIAVSQGGIAHVTGLTDSSDFPILAAPQPLLGGLDDVFVARLAADGSLLLSTFLGGSSYDACFAVGADVDGSTVVAGGTFSSNFPVKNAFQPAKGAWDDGFVTRIDAGGALAFSTYLGGAGSDAINDLAIDASGAVHVAGITDSTNFPFTPGTLPFEHHFGEYYGFVTRFGADGSLLHSAPFPQKVKHIALDPDGAIYLAGKTDQDCLPTTPGSYQPEWSGKQGPYPTWEDAWLASLTPDASEVRFCTYYGFSTADEEARDLAVGPFGESVLAVRTRSNTGTPLEILLTRLVVFDAAGTSVVLSELIGSDETTPFATAVGPDGDIYVAGYTSAPELGATPGTLQPSYAGFGDGWVRRMAIPASKVLAVRTPFDKVKHGTDLGLVVALDGWAPPGGAHVQLSTDRPDLLLLPPEVVVPEGAASVAFDVDVALTPAPGKAQITAFFGGASASAGVQVWHGPFYEVATVIDSPLFDVDARSINASGQVTGVAGSAMFGQGFYRYTPGAGIEVLSDVGIPVGIDSGGAIGGSVGYDLFLWKDLLGLQFVGSGLAQAMNDVGQIVGETYAFFPYYAQAIRCTPGGGTQLLPKPFGGTSVSRAFGINDLGQVTGEWQSLSYDWIAFRYTDGIGTELLGTLKGVGSSYGYDIDAQGNVVGTSFVPPAGSHAFLYTDQDGMIDLGILPGDKTCGAYAINAKGEIVGYSSSTSGSRPVLWTAAGEIRSLTDLVDPAALWRKKLEIAEDLNDQGEIVVSGRLRDTLCDQVNMSSAGYLLTPVPPLSSSYGAGWPGTIGVPTLSASAPPAVCSSFTIEVGSSSGLPAPGLLALGTAPAEIPTAFGGTLLVATPLLFPVAVGSSGTSMPVSLPCDASFQGSVFYLQSCQFDAGASHGAAFSAGLLLAVD